MKTTERRRKLMKILYLRGYETVKGLACDLNVSERTVRRDIELLSLSEPIYTQPGRYAGGVYVVNGYSADKIDMTEEKLSVLHKLLARFEKQDSILTDSEKQVLRAIIRDYSKPEAQRISENDKGLKKDSE